MATLTILAGWPGPIRAAEVTAARPAKPRVYYTYHDWIRDALEWNQQTLAEAYKAHGKRSPKWDDQAMAYLDAIAHQFSVGGGSIPGFYEPPADNPYTRAKAIPAGAAVLAAGCDDPLVLYCHAAMLNDENRREEALPLLRQAVGGLRAGKYPPARVAVALRRLARLTPNAAEAVEL